MCHQVHDEYVQAHCFKELSATVDIHPTIDSAFWSVHHRKNIFDLAYRLRHITFFVKWPGGSSVWEYGLCTYTDFLAAKVPQLVILHVVLEDPEIAPTTHAEASSPDFLRALSASHRWRLPQPPTTFAGRPLFKRGEGYRVGFSTSSDRVTEYTLEVFHEVANVGIYTYTLGYHPKRAYYQPRIQDISPAEQYPEEALKLFAEEGKGYMASWPTRVLEWKQKSGDELKDW